MAGVEPRKEPRLAPFEQSDHRGLLSLVRDLNRIYRATPALFEADAEPAGFEWIEANDQDHNVVAFQRIAPSNHQRIVCIGNFSPVVRREYRVGLPRAGWYREVLNTDAATYGGSNVGNVGGVQSEPIPWQGQPHSATFVLPPLGFLWVSGPEILPEKSSAQSLFGCYAAAESGGKDRLGPLVRTGTDEKVSRQQVPTPG